MPINMAPADYSSGLVSLADVKTQLGISDTDSDAVLSQLIQNISAQVERWCRRVFASTSYREFIEGTGDSLIYVLNPPIISMTRVSLGRLDVISIENSGSTVTRADANVSDETSLVLHHTIAGTTTTTTLAFSTYATLTAVVDAVNAVGSGWAATVTSTYATFASDDLIPITGLNVADGIEWLQIPDIGESHYDIDYEVGLIDLSSGTGRAVRAVEVKYTGGYAVVPLAVQQAVINLVSEAYYDAQRDTSLTGEKLGDYAWTATRAAKIEQSLYANYSRELSSYRKWNV